MDNSLNKKIGNFLISLGFISVIVGVLFFIAHILLIPPQYAYATQSSTLQLVNAVRAQHNVGPLIEIQVLDLSAYDKAKDEQDHNYFSHTDSKGRPFYYFILDAGFYHPGAPAGENLGKNYYSDAELIQAFLNSPEHRKILLDPNYHYFGFARVGRYTVMHFGGLY